MPSDIHPLMPGQTEGDNHHSKLFQCPLCSAELSFDDLNAHLTACCRETDSRMLVKCPLCGVDVKPSNLAKHMARRCPCRQDVFGVDKRARPTTTSPNRSSGPCPLCGMVLSIHKLTRHLKYRCPLNVRYFPSEILTCPWCGMRCRADDIEEHMTLQCKHKFQVRQHVHIPSRRVPVPTTRISRLAYAAAHLYLGGAYYRAGERCNWCGARIMREQLARHYAEVHTQKLEEMSESLERHIRVLSSPTNPSLGVVHSLSGTASPALPDRFVASGESGMDGSSEFNLSFRDGGQYGSMPGYDRFDDESTP